MNEQGTKMAREASKKLLQMVEDGLVDKDELILNLLNYLSENEVKAFAEGNEYFQEEEEEDFFDYEEEF